MQFPSFDFDELSESDVREEIIAPLLRHLGYRAGTASNIIRELSLTYPRVQLGRKDPARDPPLRGRADYVLEVDGKVRWTIEAKPPNAPMRPDDIEQAYTYANHPQVRAVLFCVMNGRELRIFQTNLGPGAPTLLTLSYSELAASLDRVEGLLGPDAIRRNFSHVQIETGRPLGPGLRSFARIASGYAEVDADSQGSAFLSEFTFSFCDGSVERAEQGGLVARLVIRSPLASVNRLNEVLRANELILFSEADALSTNAANPSRFSGTTTVLIPKGTWLGFAGAGVTLPDHLACEMLSEIRGHLHGHRFAGRFRQTHRYSGVPGLPNEISTSGRFEAWLA